MGSKNRVAKDILPIILKDRKPGQWYVEPFVGGANSIDKVDGKRIGADSFKPCIDALVSIRDGLGTLPKNITEFTEDDYKTVRENSDHPLYGYVGFSLSYGGKFYGGWCRDKKGIRDYVDEAYRNAVKQSPKLQGVKLINSDYLSLTIPKNSIIYCDPPYRNTTKYSAGFDHDIFYIWCEQMKDAGHTVFISEYDAPFEYVWEKEIVSSLTKDTGNKKGIERLYKV